MPNLTDDVKTFIVMALAQYDTPSEVADAVKTTFGIEISRQQVYAYDPNCSKPPAPRWQELYAATRQALQRETADIGVANKSFRLRTLDKLVHCSLANHFHMKTAFYLEQAAKECGGYYNRRAPAERALPASADEVAPKQPQME